MSVELPRTILITGASGSIGRALALEYAAPGIVLVLHARDASRLEEVANDCRARGAVVYTERFDVSDRIRLQKWLGEIDTTHPLDLIVANAGMNINMGSTREGEKWEEIQALIEVNVIAVMATLHTVLPAMRSRGSGQIAIISSLAAWRGLPETPSYCASKAAVKAYGEAMRDAVAVDGVKVNVVMPGYVHSQMAYDMPGPKPFMWTAERAAKAIRAGLQANRARISFPFPLNFGSWLLAGVHPAISSWILRRLNYGH